MIRGHRRSQAPCSVWTNGGLALRARISKVLIALGRWISEHGLPAIFILLLGPLSFTAIFLVVRAQGMDTTTTFSVTMVWFGALLLMAGYAYFSFSREARAISAIRVVMNSNNGVQLEDHIRSILVWLARLRRVEDDHVLQSDLARSSIDAVCAYLRSGPPTSDRSRYMHERATGLLCEILRRSKEWSGDLNLEGAVISDFDLSGARLTGNVNFRFAHFSGLVDFTSTRFEGRRTIFSHATFDGAPGFVGAIFASNYSSFYMARLPRENLPSRPSGSSIGSINLFGADENTAREDPASLVRGNAKQSDT